MAEIGGIALEFNQSPLYVKVAKNKRLVVL